MRTMRRPDNGTPLAARNKNGIRSGGRAGKRSPVYYNVIAHYVTLSHEPAAKYRATVAHVIPYVNPPNGVRIVPAGTSSSDVARFNSGEGNRGGGGTINPTSKTERIGRKTKRMLRTRRYTVDRCYVFRFKSNSFGRTT